MNSTTITTTGKKADISTDIFGKTLTINFSNGKSLEIDVGNLSADIVLQATLHGLKQKLVDAAAIARNTDTGKSATLADKFAAVAEVHARLTSATPSWNKVRSEGSGNGNSLLVRALMTMGNKTKAQIDAFLETKSKEEKAALRANPKVAAIIAELQAANVDESINTDDMLAELGE